MKTKLCAFLVTLTLLTSVQADEFLQPVTIAMQDPFGNPSLGDPSSDFNLPSPSNNGTNDFSAPLTNPSPSLSTPNYTVPSTDPFLNAQPMNPYQPIVPGPAPSQAFNGAQPYDFGWKQRYDVGWLPGESANPNLGDFEILEFDAEWSYSSPFAQYWIMTNTPQFGVRFWDGPNSTPLATRTLPEQVYRFGWDLELETPANGPWSFQLGFTPAISTMHL